MSREARFHPILYVRGFAMRDREIEDTIHTPYMGFNRGSTRVRQGPGGELHTFIFESPVVRLMKDYGYRDIYQDGAVHEGELPLRSLLIHRYYEDAEGRGRRPSIIEAADDLSAQILWLRDRVCGNDDAAREAFRVYLVAHSMGGLICRCLLQNEAVGDVEAKACIDKVFTYGTPHDGIEMAGFNVPRFLDLWDIDNFNREAMARYLDLEPHDGRVNHLGGRFPPERFFCLVGTNHQDYGLARLAVGPMSDGLVTIDNAWVAGAPRVHAYLSHSGHFGMVNSEPGYQNLVRFLFGDTRVTGRLVVERLPLPPSVQSARDEGEAIEGGYHFECTVTPRRFPPVPLSERRAAHGSAIFRRYDELFHPERLALERARHPVLFSLYLDSSKITVKQGRTMLFAADIAVRSTEFKVGGRWFVSRRVPDENLFREQLVILATASGKGWRLRYVLGDEEWGEGRGKAVSLDDEGKSYVMLRSRKGFQARLYLEVEDWQ
ncbi:MAG: esterase/lipase family protein [Pseudomonadota bacterium]